MTASVLFDDDDDDDDIEIDYRDDLQLTQPAMER